MPVQVHSNKLHRPKLRIGVPQKFCVLKIADLEKALNNKELEALEGIIGKIKTFRNQVGKSTQNEYLVINTDEPYAPEVIEILKANRHWG
jgi:hypothetical protein